MKKFISRILVVMMLVACFGGYTIIAAADTVSKNPLVDPQTIEYAKTPQRYTNILFLGIDFGFEGYDPSGSWFKDSIQDCHTDTVMVASINMTTDEVNLVSLPRDTFTYIPGVHGIYKLNGAFNCAETLDEAFERVRSAASWLLGGIQIDHYCAVDMGTMIKLGDFIGGVDMELEMSYTGHSGTKYKAGMQHLDGLGITDYLRARVNATVNANDIGRTGRNRAVMMAIFHKIKNNAGLIKSGWDYATSGDLNFYTDMSLAKVLNLLNKVKNAETIGSHVLTGSYVHAFDCWNFTFTNQANRIDVIKKVYGIDVPEIPYVSVAYTKWLEDEGFTTIRTIANARNLLKEVRAMGEMTDKQKAAVDKMDALLTDTIVAFDAAADSMSSADKNKMTSVRRQMRAAANEVSKLFLGKEINWYSGQLFYVEPLINEYQYGWQ